MRYSRRDALALPFGAFLAGALGPAETEAAPQPAAGRKLAVIAGVTGYGSDIPPLSFCVKDAERFRRVIQADRDVFLGSGEGLAPTRENIEQALRATAA